MSAPLSCPATALPRQVHCWLAVWACVCLLAACGSAFGQTSPSENAADLVAAWTGSSDSDLTPIRRAEDGSPRTAHARPSSAFGTLAALGLVLGGACVVMHLLQRRQVVRESNVSNAIDVLASRRLDGQLTLHLVRIGRRVIAIGSAAGSMRTLAVVDDPEEIAGLMSARDQSPAGSFSGWSSFLNRKTPHADMPRTQEDVSLAATAERQGRAA